ncbi:MAG: sigma-70 family RNA polymerase sigma factor, partial [Sphingobacteriales bacterium]
ITDEELMSRLSQRDQAAFTEIYERFAPRLLGLAMVILKDRCEAEDVIQESFLFIWNKAAQFDAERGKAFTWATLTVRHRAIDRLRSLARRRPERLENFEPTTLGGDLSLSPDVAAVQNDRQQQAQTMLKDVVAGNKLDARAVFTLKPAARISDDDLVVYEDESRQTVAHTFHHLRQQTDNVNRKPNMSLADYIATVDSPAQDYLGGFTVSVFGAEEMAVEYRAKGDDYSAILVQSLADRLVEAFAEHLHERVRKEFWGYVSDEALDNDALIKEQYVGIRPAPGYPACPEHSEKVTLFNWLNTTETIGTQLTEHYAMIPPSSVSGFYYSHPESDYFNVGKIGRDQLEDYAKRKGW